MVDFIKPVFFGLLCSGFLLTYTTAVAVYFRRKAPGARFFGVFLLFVSFWASTYFFETMSSDPHWKELIFNFKYLLIVNIPVLFVQFTMEFTGTTKRERIIVHSLLLVFSTIILGLIFINPNGQVIESTEILMRNDISLFVIQRGPIHLVIDIFLLVLMLVGLLLLAKRMELGNKDERNHFLIISTAVCLPVMGIVLEIGDIGSFGLLDTPTFFFLFSAIIIDIGMIKFDLFHINIMSRDRLMENINEGIIFVGPGKMIVDMNRKAMDILGMERPIFKERSLKDLNRELNETLKEMDRKDLKHGEVEYEGGKVVFEVRSTDIRTPRDSLLGKLILLRDISEKKRYQKALLKKKEELKNFNEILEVINKILRHDLMNDLMIMKMARGTYKRTGDVCLLDNLDTSLDRSVSLIRRMRELEMSMKQGKGYYPMDIRKVFVEISTRFDIQVDVVGGCTVLADEAVHSIALNLLTNARKHGKADLIEIDIADRNGQCVVTVIDNGIGMPEDVAERMFEEGFSHGTSRGSGLGMYIVKRTMRRYGGIARILHSGPKGTSIQLEFLKP